MWNSPLGRDVSGGCATRPCGGVGRKLALPGVGRGGCDAESDEAGMCEVDVPPAEWCAVLESLACVVGEDGCDSPGLVDPWPREWSPLDEPA